MSGSPIGEKMCSILDIDLDYFNIMEEPVQRLNRLMTWAGHPVDFIVEKHYAVLKRWREHIRKRGLPYPTHILHVDEHHDMMDEQAVPNSANIMVHALRRWPQCRVHWLVEQPIDSPEMWLSGNTWEQLTSRFSMGPRKPRSWPRPDIVSVCTSPSFVHDALRQQLLVKIKPGPALTAR